MNNKVPRIKYNQSFIDNIKDSNKWWKSEPDKTHIAVWSCINFIKQTQYMRHHNNNLARHLYENDFGKNISMQLLTDQISDRLDSQVSFNVIKSCIDTARSKIAKTKPRPYFLTDNGDWHLQQKARRLNRFILGLFQNIGTDNGLIRESLYKIGSEVFFDAALTGTGTAKMLLRNDKVMIERFFSDELIIDSFEGMYRTPRSAHLLKYVDREVVKAAYPEAKYLRMIEGVRSEASSKTQDMIPIIESFHLPSGKNAKDGIRAVTINTGTLHYTSWDKIYFPILIQRWNLRPIGYFGLGLAEELYGLQWEITRTIHSISLGLRRIAVPRVFRHISDHNVLKKMKNIIGETHFYNDRPPIFNTPTAFQMETYNYLEMLYRKAFEITGISRLSAQAQKPAGINSGIGLRNFQDIESERFSDVHIMYENFFVQQATHMVLDHLNDLLDVGVDTIVQAKDGVTMQPIKYSDVKLPKESFSVMAYPTAFLPSEPSGKLEKVQDLIRIGVYDQDEARELLDFPDLSKMNRLKSAPRTACLAYIEKMLETGKYMPIEPYQDLELTKRITLSYYLEGRANNMPQDRLDLLRRILTEIKTKIDAIVEEKMRLQQQQQEQAMLQQQVQQQVPVA